MQWPLPASLRIRVCPAGALPSEQDLLLLRKIG